MPGTIANLMKSLRTKSWEYEVELSEFSKNAKHGVTRITDLGREAITAGPQLIPAIPELMPALLTFVDKVSTVIPTSMPQTAQAAIMTQDLLSALDVGIKSESPISPDDLKSLVEPLHAHLAQHGKSIDDETTRLEAQSSQEIEKAVIEDVEQAVNTLISDVSTSFRPFLEHHMPS